MFKLSSYLVACDVLDLAGEGDVAAHPDGVVGHRLEEAGALGGWLPDRSVRGAAWQHN